MIRFCLLLVATASVANFTARNFDAAVIILNDVNPGGSDPVALAAFATAANLWTSKSMARLMTGADLGNSRLTRGRKARPHNHNLAFRPRVKRIGL